MYFLVFHCMVSLKSQLQHHTTMAAHHNTFPLLHTHRQSLSLLHLTQSLILSWMKTLIWKVLEPEVHLFFQFYLFINFFAISVILFFTMSDVCDERVASDQSLGMWIPKTRMGFFQCIDSTPKFLSWVNSSKEVLKFWCGDCGQKDTWALVGF